MKKEEKQKVGWGQLARRKEQPVQRQAGVQWCAVGGYLCLASEISGWS